MGTKGLWNIKRVLENIKTERGCYVVVIDGITTHNHSARRKPDGSLTTSAERTPKRSQCQNKTQKLTDNKRTGRGTLQCLTPGTS